MQLCLCILKPEATHSHSAVAQMYIEADLYSFVGEAAPVSLHGFLPSSKHPHPAGPCLWQGESCKSKVGPSVRRYGESRLYQQ